MDKYARSRAWFEEAAGYDEDEGGNEGRFRSYPPTGEEYSGVRLAKCVTASTLTRLFHSR